MPAEAQQEPAAALLPGDSARLRMGREQLRKWAALYALPPAEQRQEQESWLLFMLGEGRYALPMAVVDEIIPVQHGHHLPVLIPGFLGLLSWQQELLLLWDTGKLLGHAASVQRHSHQMAIVCQGSQGRRLAFLVDRILGQEAWSRQSLQSVPSLDAQGAGLLMAVQEEQGCMTHLLDADRFLAVVQTMLKRLQQEKT
ncbi:MAG: chemotaxis protein CheW [Magnetococcales bacterium]|nr:chemotaxis protein CheW [Magnetococcales bacterium]MBF0114225.1 chemotaxis protein CheW [Magnetococcales bacterium]